jgi:hypothetical protein
MQSRQRASLETHHLEEKDRHESQRHDAEPARPLS